MAKEAVRTHIFGMGLCSRVIVECYGLKIFGYTSFVNQGKGVVAAFNELEFG